MASITIPSPFSLDGTHDYIFTNVKDSITLTVPLFIEEDRTRVTSEPEHSNTLSASQDDELCLKHTIYFQSSGIKIIRSYSLSSVFWRQGPPNGISFDIFMQETDPTVEEASSFGVDQTKWIDLRKNNSIKSQCRRAFATIDEIVQHELELFSARCQLLADGERVRPMKRQTRSEPELFPFFSVQLVQSFRELFVRRVERYLLDYRLKAIRASLRQLTTQKRERNLALSHKKHELEEELALLAAQEQKLQSNKTAAENTLFALIQHNDDAAALARRVATKELAEASRRLERMGNVIPSELIQLQKDMDKLEEEFQSQVEELQAREETLRTEVESAESETSLQLIYIVSFQSSMITPFNTCYEVSGEMLPADKFTSDDIERTVILSGDETPGDLSIMQVKLTADQKSTHLYTFWSGLKQRQLLCRPSLSIESHLRADGLPLPTIFFHTILNLLSDALKAENNWDQLFFTESGSTRFKSRQRIPDAYQLTPQRINLHLDSEDIEPTLRIDGLMAKWMYCKSIQTKNPLKTVGQDVATSEVSRSSKSWWASNLRLREFVSTVETTVKGFMPKWGRI